MKALALQPSDRYASVTDLRREIEHYQAGFATEAEHAGLVRCNRGHARASFSPDGSSVAVVGGGATDGDLPQILRAGDGSVCLQLGTYHHDLHFGPNGEDLWGAHRGTVRRWNSEDGALLGEWHCEDDMIKRISLSPDGDRFLTLTTNGRLTLRNAETAEAILEISHQALHGHTPLACPRFTQNGAEILFLDQPTGRKTELVKLHIDSGSREVLCRAWISGFKRSPRGNRILLVTHRTVQIVESWDGEPVLEWEPHAGWIKDADWSPDGKRIVTAGHDQTAAVWDAETGRELLRLRRHEAVVASAEFSPDGKTILTSGQDGKVILWKTQ